MTDLQDAAHSISYEARQIANAIACLQRLCTDGSEPALAPLLIEAFLLHYRNLRDFLVGKPNDDDMSAGYFCPRWKLSQWPDHFNDSRARTDPRYSERQLINKRLSHLTHFREEIRKDSTLAAWPLLEMYATVHNEFQNFVCLLTADEQGWFAECLHLLSTTAAGLSVLTIGKVSNSTQSD